VRLQRLPGPQNKNVILAKLEGNNPAGSVKDRPAISMIRHAEERGRIKRGDTLIEPTSGNTGIALAMAAATRGYKMVLIMPEHLSAERRQTMRAFGAELVLTPQKGGMEAARHQHRQVEIAAVPGDELRRVFVDAVEEALDRNRLGGFGLADREHPHLVVMAQHAGDHHHALQMRRQKVVPRGGAALLERHLGDLGVGKIVGQLVKAPDAGTVRDRLDVEGKGGRHQSGKTPVVR